LWSWTIGVPRSTRPITCRTSRVQINRRFGEVAGQGADQKAAAGPIDALPKHREVPIAPSDAQDVGVIVLVFLFAKGKTGVTHAARALCALLGQRAAGSKKGT
jgi:hypothetical protein